MSRELGAMWKATSISALVLGSSLALLTGAQATPIEFGPGTPPAATAPNSVNFVNSSGAFNMLFFVPQSGNASFNGLSGTYTFSGPTSPVTIPVSGSSGTFNLGPNSETFSASFGADSLTGTVNLTQVQEAPNATFNGDFNANLIGDFTVTTRSGDPTFLSNFSAGTAAFQWALECGPFGGPPGGCVRTLSQTAAATGFFGAADPYTTSTGSVDLHQVKYRFLPRSICLEAHSVARSG